jgi:uncharacterized repeat protein (TIGR02543 family)
LVGNSSRALGILANVSYLVSIAISWLTGDETVPDTAADKPISVTITNSTIKAGASAYAIVNNVSTLLGTATQDGTITVLITADPEVVVVATKPNAPTSVAATSNGNQSSTVSWSAPASNGGSAITGYTVTSNDGKTCATANLTCSVTGLADGTAYTFTVTATNAVGISAASSPASASTAGIFAVAFDAKSGSVVTGSTFLTAGTVAEPTAPTRAGYGFAGWSATDGGSVVTMPYAPGVITDITLYAKWNVVSSNNSGGGNSGNSGNAGNSGKAGNTTPVTPAASARPTVPVVKTTGTDAGTVSTSVLPITARPNTPEVKLVKFAVSKADQKFVDKVELVGDKLNIVAAENFSGKRTVIVTITENGVDKTIDIPFVVLPQEVTVPVTTPLSTTKSLIDWKPSPNANKYDVFVNGKKVCSTTASSCEVRQLLGPNAKVEIVANGGDQTKSETTATEFEQPKPIKIAALSGSTKIKTTLSATDRLILDKLISTVQRQGFGTVLISQTSFTKSTQAAAQKRIQAIEDYIQKGVGKLVIDFKITDPTKKTYINNISVQD